MIRKDKRFLQDRCYVQNSKQENFELGLRMENVLQPDKLKQVQEIIFSRKTRKVIHPSAIFNNMPVVCSSCETFRYTT